MSEDLAAAARDRLRQQRRRTAVAVATGVTVSALMVGLGWTFGRPSRTAAPAAIDTSSSATPTPSPTASPTVKPASEPPARGNRAVAKNVLLNTWLEHPNGFTELVASVPLGGRV